MKGRTLFRDVPVRYIALWLAGVLLVTHAAANPRCDALIAEFHGGRTEAELLAAFRPEGIRRGSVTELADGVLKVEVDGVDYVLRVPDAETPPGFESFASTFVRAAPEGTTPEVRVLGKAETAKLLDHFDDMGGVGARELLDADPKTISVVVHFPIELGEDYERRLGVGEPWRRTLLHFATMSREKLDAKARIDHRVDWRTAFETSTPADKRTLVAELRKLGPPFADVTAENLDARVNDFLVNGDPATLAPLFESSLARIPADVRRQLADHWMLATALGIPDFHSGNWLIKNDRVLAIDLAWRTPEFSRGKPDPALRASQGFPLFGVKTERMRRLMVESASPEMRAYLRNLTAADIRAIAARAKFTVTDKQVDGILARLRNLEAMAPPVSPD